MKTLVTGGGGFLGTAMVRLLRERGDEVTVVGRNDYPHVQAMGATCVQQDLREVAGLTELCAGMDVVFHVAAKPGFWGDRDEFMSINVDGTAHMLQAARSAGVGRFVYTSSPSVTFHGTDEDGLKPEQCTYPERFSAYYPESKARAEQLVLQASDETFATTSLRPHYIYGPDEPNLIPRLLDRVDKGRVAIIGDGTNRVGFTYVDNAAVAHLQAADALRPGSANAGKAYFITDAEPVRFWDFANAVIEGTGRPRVTRKVSRASARRLAGVVEWTWRSLRLGGEPPTTPFVIDSMACAHWWDLTSARSDFGYAPLVDGEEGLRRTIEALRARSSR